MMINGFRDTPLLSFEKMVLNVLKDTRDDDKWFARQVSYDGKK